MAYNVSQRTEFSRRIRRKAALGLDINTYLRPCTQPIGSGAMCTLASCELLAAGGWRRPIARKGRKLSNRVGLRWMVATQASATQSNHLRWLGVRFVSPQCWISMNSAELWRSRIDHKNKQGIAFQHASDRLCAFPRPESNSNRRRPLELVSAPERV